MPIYQINKIILTMLTRLHNQSVDVASLKKENFGISISNGGEELHELITTVVPMIEKQTADYFRSGNKLHLSNMMSMLDQCIRNEENVQRLLRMQSGRPQFMFVDEFQDTDDVQMKIFELLIEGSETVTFVGDPDQSIYGFRGSDNKFFKRLLNNDEFKRVDLLVNYRTPQNIIDFNEEFIKNHGRSFLKGDVKSSNDNVGDLYYLDSVNEKK